MPRRIIVLPLILLALASSLLLALLVTSAAGSAASTTCTAAQKAQRQAALRAYQGKMPAARKAYFKAHNQASLRAAFVKAQQAKLARLRHAAACVVSQPAPPPPTGPIPAPPPGANELFNFDSGITAADQEEIKGDVAYAVQDEAALLGAPISAVTTFVSKNPGWLADQECRVLGFLDENCVQHVRERYAGGGSTGEAGPGGIFLYWASPSWGFGASQNQKIIAHELHHVFQYQLDRVSVNSGDDSHVPPSGPVWLIEGSAELIGYRIADDRWRFPYANILADQISRAKQFTVPLSSLERRVDVQIANVYSLFHVAADHLVSITPAGVSALTTYLNGLGAGMAWQDAFRAAFGMSVDAYYANFAAYRAGL